MNITSIKTEKIIPNNHLFTILNNTLPLLTEKSILVITSKIVALCENSIVSKNSVEKETLIQQQSDYYIPSQQNKYHVTLTIKNNTLIPSAGIDESNANGYYVLWPKDPQQTANHIRKHLISRFKLNHIGVIITDSKTTPLRWGTTGIAIAHSGFHALNNYIGQPDIFGRTMNMTKANIMDGLAAAAVVVMGEGNEQTPLAIITEIPFCQFQNRNPTDEELQQLKINLEDDLYSPLLQTAHWKKREKSSHQKDY